ncbi:MAG: cobalamin adenosyltransferase [Flavobacteriales bacterium]|nr:MAG: cobalamin adenosyltransferase [Flavobacteriales bacterium]
MKTINQLSISISECESMFVRAIEEAEKQGIGISLCVVDSSGVLKYFGRMDNAPLISIDISRKKAVTAIGFGMSTGEAWHDFIKDDPILNDGVVNIKDFILLGGGSPIVHDGNVIGAIGVSGGHYKQDEECVKAALNEL